MSSALVNGEHLHQGNALLHGARLNGEAVQKFYRMVKGLHGGHAISLISPREREGDRSGSLPSPERAPATLDTVPAPLTKEALESKMPATV
ncbi:hypothetical protein E2562_036921 [Oryza meyeriana var. granulata]|uniref:Uncharacterized protein n=1 Tax=Oryza meyeriana var. granulata TaxID=110450 RepID=A0A6G1CKC1_9ORYZ|nr:hypothetical protein E2562_036921 [Oryza meyeriana var. granulata]